MQVLYTTYRSPIRNTTEEKPLLEVRRGGSGITVCSWDSGSCCGCRCGTASFAGSGYESGASRQMRRQMRSQKCLSRQMRSRYHYHSPSPSPSRTKTKTT